MWAIEVGKECGLYPEGRGMRRFRVCLGRVAVDGWREVGLHVRQEGGGSGTIWISSQQ